MDKFIQDFDYDGSLAKKIHKETELMILNNQDRRIMGNNILYVKFIIKLILNKCLNVFN